MSSPPSYKLTNELSKQAFSVTTAVQPTVVEHRKRKNEDTCLFPRKAFTLRPSHTCHTNTL